MPFCLLKFFRRNRTIKVSQREYDLLMKANAEARGRMLPELADEELFISSAGDGSWSVGDKNGYKTPGGGGFSANFQARGANERMAINEAKLREENRGN